LLRNGCVTFFEMTERLTAVRGKITCYQMLIDHYCVSFWCWSERGTLGKWSFIMKWFSLN